MHKKTILLTGYKGFVGSALSEKLKNKYNIIYISRNEIYNGDQNIDFLVHLGAFMPKSIDELNMTDKILENNIIATNTLLQSLTYKPKKIIFSSTIDVYDYKYNDIINETSKLDPQSLYGSSKLFCEKLILEYCKSNNCKYAILRYGNIYGPKDTSYSKFIPKTILSAIDDRAISLYGDGKCLRDYIFIDDVVEYTIRAIESEQNIDPINIVSGESNSIKYLTELILNITNSNSNIEYINSEVIMSSRQFDNSKMFSIFGNYNFTKINDGINKQFKYFLNLK
jgi:UDP-glucose 4-epimerase